MDKYVQDNGKIIRSLISSVQRLTKEVIDNLRDNDIDVLPGVNRLPAGSPEFSHNKMTLVYIEKMEDDKFYDTIRFGFTKPKEESVIWIWWAELTFTEQAMLAIYLTQIFKS